MGGNKDEMSGGFAEAPPSRLTAMDIQQKEFRIARFRGYKERDVDEFLDHLTVSVQALTDENERLRRQVSGSSGTDIGAPDLADVSRQADEIIERARAEASRIIRDAEARGAVAGGTSAPGASGDRAAMSAFLAKEKEFLTGMASFVQDHAEDLKAMARETFAKPAEPAPDAEEAQPVEAEPTAAQPPKEEEEETSAPLSVEEAEEPIRIVEPEPASVRGSEDDPDGGDRSLRDLFWGEE